MDEQVLRSLIKWPSVPECRGWLALDRRGNWRMRNEFAQKNHLPGDIIQHSGLVSFIERNYATNEDGEWFFQNGPQRVYVDLDYTPLVARFYPDKETYLLKTTTGIPIKPTQCLMDEKGQIVLTAHIEVQYAPTTNETLFLKETKEVHVLLHNHDLGIFSETAEVQHACGLLGHWNWQGQKIAVESATSADIKKIYCTLP
ncbi:DUF2946 family protein [Polynucleobacter sp. MWH-Spelu-300-X4]|uniref:DUF2946 family protein n=1 Tax=Polynucleobacter sp. MWH-Spelu-300-X4 TaxID=2689109 RepID=UPI001BFD5164|nr:DUF2946 family protein [Polynucleobacter sp. MWH-Spelu-300-X4]QWD79564.1 DUF2946 family protein [Polynucleobacter sp. MWH-Spelu-300-X4]